MGKPELKKTESTFSANETKNRAYDTRRDNDKIRKISVTTYDIDYAVKWHLQNIIRPTIVEDNTQITVPVMFSTGEKWATAQRAGFLRDSNNMIMSPLIMLRRTSMEPRTDLENNNVLRGITYNTGNKILFEKKYTPVNRYDRFSVNTKTNPLKEFYAVDFPKFVSVNYDLLIWTNGMEQLNDICEQLVYFDGKAWGDAFKFITYTDTPTYETINDLGSDRLVRATFTLRTQAYLIPDRSANDSGLEKFYSVDRIMIATETEVSAEDLDETFAERKARTMSLLSDASKKTQSAETVTSDSNDRQLAKPTAAPEQDIKPPVVPPGDRMQWPRPDSII